MIRQVQQESWYLNTSYFPLAAQPSNTDINGNVDSVARQNFASMIEHCSGRRSLSESLLTDPNSSSGNVSLRKQFHDEEDTIDKVPKV